MTGCHYRGSGVGKPIKPVFQQTLSHFRPPPTALLFLHASPCSKLAEVVGLKRLAKGVYTDDIAHEVELYRKKKQKIKIKKLS